jgi:tetratricopeptide (TPR) repeat protein
MFDKHEPLSQKPGFSVSQKPGFFKKPGFSMAEVLTTAIAISLLTTSGAVASMGEVANQSIVESSPEILAQNQGALEYLEEGINLYREGKIEAAEASFRQAIEIDPELAQAHANLGTVLANQNKMAEAIPEFEEAVRLKPEMAFLHYQLGVALYMENRAKEAIDSLEEARDLLKEEGKPEQAEQIEQAIAKIESES